VDRAPRGKIFVSSIKTRYVRADFKRAEHFLFYYIAGLALFGTRNFACHLKKVEIFQFPRRTLATRADNHILCNINYAHSGPRGPRAQGGLIGRQPLVCK